LAIRSPIDAVRRHPYIFGAALTSLLSAYCYYRPPAFFRRVPGLRTLVVPRSKAVVRPRRLTDGTRLDAVLVLGAERGSLGREIALDLERRGLIVLATVPDAGEVEALERLGRGHLKALVLDPTDPGTIPQMLRSLSTSLSLRFPLNSPGDPFRPAHQTPSLCSVVNALALATHCSTSHGSTPVGPLEAISLASLSALLQGRVVASLAVLQGTLPLLRSAPGKATVVTLVPASTSRVALPYVGAQSIADGALAALTDVLRREVGNDKVIVSNIDVGFFQRSHHGSRRVIEIH
jgi:NAD(P)-dependent dehydrogenase (short-subunit alcohol dehydrogenase family)